MRTGMDQPKSDTKLGREEPDYSHRPVMFRDRPLQFILLLLLVPVVIGALGLLGWWLGVLSNKLTIVGGRMRYEQGLLNKRRKEVTLANIRAVEVYQTLFNRIFDVGEVKVYTTGDHPEIVVRGLPQPQRIKELVAEKANI
jgi:Predicted membrane protein